MKIANELRIGNLFLAGKMVEPQSVFSFNYERENDEYIINGSIPISHIKGISLTPELLIKCGFEEIPHYTVTNSLILNISRNRHLSIGCVGTPNEMLWLCNIDGKRITDLVCLHNFDYDGKLYLHKLQNFIHILTGEELNID